MKKILFGSLMVSFLLGPMRIFAQESLPPGTGFEARLLKCESGAIVTQCKYVDFPSTCDPSQQELC